MEMMMEHETLQVSGGENVQQMVVAWMVGKGLDLGVAFITYAVARISEMRGMPIDDITMYNAMGDFESGVDGDGAP